MSQTDQGHWREPPTDRVNPDYPVHLTERYSYVDIDPVCGDGDGKTIIYEGGVDAENRWIKGVAFNREDMV